MMNNRPTYRFYIETDTDYIEWNNLTHKQARDMYAYTDSHQPSNVTNYGWELVERSPLPEPLTQNS